MVGAGRAVEREPLPWTGIGTPNDPVGGMYALSAWTRSCRVIWTGPRCFSNLAKRCQTLPFPHGPFTECYGLVQEAVVRTDAGHYEHAVELAGRINPVATQNGLDEWVFLSASAAANATAKSAAMAAEPDPATLGAAIDGLAMIVQLWREYQLKAFLCLYDGGLAEPIWRDGGSRRRGYGVDMALRSPRTNWHIFYADLLRIRATPRSPPPTATPTWPGPSELAREQGALTLQLRAVADCFRPGESVPRRAAVVLGRFPAEQDWPTWPERALLY